MANKITSKSAVRVIWNDRIENYSKEKIIDIKNKIKHKYGSTSIRVDFVPTNKLNVGLVNFDDEDIQNINRPETQEKIILQYIEDNNLDITIDDIKRLNKKVEAAMTGFSEAKDNKWKIKNITIENFLSYQDKVTLDFDSLKGLTLIQGDNFAGKTSLIIDSLRFLLFNTTSKTAVADEVINVYTKPDFCSVEAELIIDNIDYKIERRVERPKNWRDKPNYKSTTVLNFSKMGDDGKYELQNGEKRQETDKILRENIGNEREFLMTVLCTGKNLFDIIEAKPTERGKLLTKFLGLEIFEAKEEAAKKLLSEWKLKSKIDKYSSTELQGVIENNENIILESQEKIQDLKKEHQILLNDKTKLAGEKDLLLKLFYRDIDSGMSNLTEQFFVDKIARINKQIIEKNLELTKTNELIGNKDLVFDKDEYYKVRGDESTAQMSIANGEMQLSSYRDRINNLKNGEKCSACGQSLKDVDHTEEIKSVTELGKALKKIVDEAKIRLDEIKPKLVELELLKDKVSKQEVLKITRDKIEVEIENLENKLSSEKDNHKRFLTDLDKIEKNKELDIQVRRKDIEIADVTNKEYQKNREIQTYENTISNSNKIIGENKLLIETIKKEEHIAKVFAIYIAMMGKNGISKTIIKNTVPVLNLELSKLLMECAEFTVSIDVNEKNNDVEFWMIDNETDIKKPLDSGSGYETFIGALALRVINAKVNALPKPSLLLLDEVFGTVSNTNLDLVKGFIDRIIRDLDNIFIITHNELVKEWADNIITVIKQKNVSTIH